MRDIVMSFIYPRLIMYGNGDDSPAPKKKKHVQQDVGECCHRHSADLGMHKHAEVVNLNYYGSERRQNECF